MICLNRSGTQSGLSVQFDDLFKKAWDEDAVGDQEDGI